MVGGVDQIAEAEKPGTGETVTIKLTVEKKAENAAANAEVAIMLQRFCALEKING